MKGKMPYETPDISMIMMQGEEKSCYSVPYLLSQYEVDAIPINYLISECVDAMFDGYWNGDSMSVIYTIVKRWREKNETVG